MSAIKTVRKITRGAGQEEVAVFIGAWVPETMAEAIDKAVTRLDLDRSKFLRRALEEKCQAQGNGTNETR